MTRRINYAGLRQWMMIMQVIAVVLCMAKRNSDKTVVVQGCVESRLNLSCEVTREIEIITVVLGDSWCKKTSCCIKDDDCTRPPSDQHVVHVNNSCNGRRNCMLAVHKEKIYCPGWPGSDNDFERITYRCKYQKGLQTTPLPSDQTTSPDSSSDAGRTISTSGTPGETTSAENGTAGGNPSDVSGSSPPYESSDTFIFPTVLGIICFVIFVFIVVLAIIIARRRKRWPPVKYEMELSYANSSSGTDEAYLNDDQSTTNHISNSQPGGTTAANTTSIYDRPRSVVYSAVCKTDSMVKEDQTNAYSDVKEKHTDHQRDSAYSFVRNSCEVGPDSSDGNIYDDVETKENFKAEAAKHDTETYDEACEWKDVDQKKQKSANKSPGVKLTIAGKTQNEYARNNNRLRNTTTSPEAFYMNTEEIANGSSNGSCSSPVYEPMTPGVTPEGIYANQPVLSFSRTRLDRGSETDSQYCVMQSPRVQLEDDGMKIVVDNELYGSK